MAKVDFHFLDKELNYRVIAIDIVAHGCLVVSVLPLNTRVADCKPAEDNGFSSAIKISCTSFFRGE
jgi:hypothetical protein